MLQKNDFDSTEEYWIYLYLMELEKNNFIKSIKIQVTYPLFKTVILQKQIQLKTKIKNKEWTLLKKRDYTLDFEVEWNISSFNIFFTEFTNPETFISNISFQNNNSYTSYLEIKGMFDRNNMTRLFTSRTQPMMWEKFNIYVQLIKPLDLFKNTFIPTQIYNLMFYQKDVYIGKGKNKKLIHHKGDKKYVWDYKTLNEFINK